MNRRPRGNGFSSAQDWKPIPRIFSPTKPSWLHLSDDPQPRVWLVDFQSRHVLRRGFISGNGRCWIKTARTKLDAVSWSPRNVRRWTRWHRAKSSSSSAWYTNPGPTGVRRLYTPQYGAHPPRKRINPLNTKLRLLYLKTQFVPRSKHFSSQL